VWRYDDEEGDVLPCGVSLKVNPPRCLAAGLIRRRSSWSMAQYQPMKSLTLVTSPVREVS
jgi:hypothetical protein